MSLLERGRMLGKRCWLIVVLLATVIWAEESTDLKFSAWGWYTFGKVGSGFSQRGSSAEADVDFTGFWLTDVNAGVKIEKNFAESFKFRLHLGFTTGFQVQDQQTNASKEFLQRKFATYIIDAAIQRCIPLNETNKLCLEFGYFPVRYNPQAANLGEYLFGRTTPYPAVVQSGFELADKEKIPGLRIGYSMNFGTKSLLKLDNYLFTELKQWPIGDISEALLFSINTEQIFELGLGINFHHLISVDERQTTPGLDRTRRTTTFPERLYYVNPDDLTDTAIYTARGIKLMGRFTFNPRAFIHWNALGDEDLKLFAEAAVLGVKNFPGWYENIGERIPVMFGFNFPGFKVIDVISLQLQWFGNKYWNTWENMQKDGCIVPYIGQRGKINYDIDYIAQRELYPRITEDDWKWSIYMSKKINNRWRLSLQFANDNMFKTVYMPPPPAPSKYTEITRRTWAANENGKNLFFQIWDWYWMGRIMFYF